MPKKRNIHHNKTKTKTANKTKIKHKAPFSGTIIVTISCTQMAYGGEQALGLGPPPASAGPFGGLYNLEYPFSTYSTPHDWFMPANGYLYPTSKLRSSLSDPVVTVTGDADGLRSLDRFPGDTLPDKVAQAFYHLHGIGMNANETWIIEYQNIHTVVSPNWNMDNGVNAYAWDEFAQITYEHTWTFR